MPLTSRIVRFLLVVGCLAYAAPSGAQSLGTFSWQLQPYCNRLIVQIAVEPDGYSIDGRDDQCGQGPAGRVTGTARLNGTEVVLRLQSLVPGVKDVHIVGSLTLASLNGTWTDSAGLEGTLTFGGTAAGAVASTPALPQQRVAGSCASGASIRAIAANGTVTCETDDVGTVSAGSITSAELSTGAVTAVAVAAEAVGTTALASASVTAAKIATGAVGSTAIADGGITAAKIATGAVGSTAIAAGSITAAKMAAGAVGSTAIADGSITAAKMAAGAVGSTAIADGSISASDLSAGAVTGSRSGLENVAIGPGSLAALTDGFSNTGFGQSALAATTSGYKNAAYGAGALALNTQGASNSAIGYRALRANSLGNSGTAVGSDALGNNTTGNDNTAVGMSVLGLNTVGIRNTGTGSLALQNTTASFNTAMGYEALINNTTGSSNTAVGYQAGPTVSNLSNTTALGNGATVSASNTIRLGNGSVTTITGQVAFTASSDRHKKEGFRPLDGDAVLQKLRSLEVTSWNYIGHDATQFRHYGPMAQDFFERFGHDGVGRIGTDVTLNSGDVSGILMAALQAADRRTDALTAEVARLERERSAQWTQLTVQAAALADLRTLVETLARQLAQQR